MIQININCDVQLLHKPQFDQIEKKSSDKDK